MSDEDLIEEMGDLRRYVDKPKLLGRDWITAVSLSTAGVGSFISFCFGIGHSAIQKDDTSIIKHLKNVMQAESSKEYWQENKDFRNNVNITIGSFIVSSLLSLPYFLKIQRQTRARESAVKLEYVSRVLQERGYEEDIYTRTFTKVRGQTPKDVAEDLDGHVSNRSEVPFTERLSQNSELPDQSVLRY